MSVQKKEKWVERWQPRRDRRRDVEEEQRKERKGWRVEGRERMEERRGPHVPRWGERMAWGFQKEGGKEVKPERREEKGGREGRRERREGGLRQERGQREEREWEEGIGRRCWVWEGCRGKYWTLLSAPPALWQRKGQGWSPWIPPRWVWSRRTQVWVWSEARAGEDGNTPG